jgi:hypothetical protein
MTAGSDQGKRMRTHAEAWLVILAVLGVLTYLIVTQTLEHWQFTKECSDLGMDRMVQRPSDDDLRHLVDDCERGWRRR